MVWADSRGLTDAEGGDLLRVENRGLAESHLTTAGVLTHTEWTVGWLYTKPIHTPGLARRVCHEGSW